MLLLGLAGCGSDNPPPAPKPTPTPTPDPTPDPIPITGPQQFQLTGVDEKIEIMFTPNFPWGGAGGIAAKYDLRYATEDYSNDLENPNVVKLGTDYLPSPTPTTPGTGLVNGTLENLENGKTYYVWIAAVYEGVGKSGFHMETAMPIPWPLPPASVYQLSGENMIDVVWDPVDYAFSYEVAIHTGSNSGGGMVAKRTTTDTRYILTVGDVNGTPLANGTTYNIWVKAINTNGGSAYTEPIKATPAAATAAPAAPGALTVEPGNKRLKMTWTAVRWATSYELFYGTSNNVVSATRASVVDPASGKVSATIAGLENGKLYYVWVNAKNSVGSSDYSPAGTGTPKDIAIPIVFNDYSFQLGEAANEYIFAEFKPENPFQGTGRSGVIQDRLHRYKETPLGNLFTDSVMWYLRDRYPDENVDFVFLNGGYVDNLIKKGGISVGSVAGAVDSNSREDVISLISMKGSDIKALFKWAAENVQHTGSGTGGTPGTGAWPMTSKEVNYTLSYKFVDADVMSAGWGTTLSSRLDEFSYGEIKPGTLKINGADFDDNTTYRIATTDYQADGKQHLLLFTKGTDRRDLFTPYWHAVAEYIYEEGSVLPAIDGRIRIEGGVPGGPLGVPELYNQYCPADATWDAQKGCIF